MKKGNAMTVQQVYESWLAGLITTREAITQLSDMEGASARQVVGMLRALEIPFYEAA